MGAFGSNTIKATRLYSNCPLMMMDLKKSVRRKDFPSGKTTDIVRTYTDRAGKRRVCGGAGLKGTQAYPDGFGVEVAASYARHTKSFDGAPELHQYQQQQQQQQHHKQPQQQHPPPTQTA